MEGLHLHTLEKKSANIQPQHPYVFLHIKIDHLQSKSRHFFASNNMIHQTKQKKLKLNETNVLHFELENT